jgi:Ca2+ transporting ATPase
MISGTAIAVLTVVIMFVRYSVSMYVIDKQEWHMSHAQKFVSFIITGITVLVVAVPEGLPLAVTLSLAYSVKVSCKISIYA